MALGCHHVTEDHSHKPLGTLLCFVASVHWIWDFFLTVAVEGVTAVATLAVVKSLCV